jgi:hypothetical protein
MFGSDDPEPPKKSLWQKVKANKGTLLKVGGGLALAGLGAAGAYQANKRGMFSKPPVMATKDIITTDAKAIKQAGSSKSNEKEKERQDKLKQKQSENKAIHKAKKQVTDTVMINQLPEKEKEKALNKRTERAENERLRKSQAHEDTANQLKDEYQLFFGKRSRFGSKKNELNKIDLNKIEQQIKPEKKSRIKRALYNLLKKSGVKVGEYADHTFKQILTMTVRFLGPIVLMAILFKYRGTAYRTLVSQQDRDNINSCINGVCDIGRNITGQFTRR